MSILDRKYIVTANLDNGTVEAPKTMEFYNTDENIANIYLVLIKKGLDGVDAKLTYSELADYTVTLQAVKPRTNQIRKLNAIENIDIDVNAPLKFELDSEFTNQSGKVKNQLFITVDTKKLTIKDFSYTINPSVVTGLNDEIESSPEKPILLELIDRVEDNANILSETMQTTMTELTKEVQKVNYIDNQNITDTNTYSNKKIEEKFDGVDAQFNTVGQEINKKAEKFMVTEMPIFMDTIKFQNDKSTLDRLELLDVHHYALATHYAYSDFYKISLDSLEQIKLCDTGITTPYWHCAKLLPRFGYTYDWIIAWARNKNAVYRISTNGAVVTPLSDQNWGWLPNTGFDFVPNSSGYANGTMIYAEYILPDFNNYSTATTINVWRSTDAGATWAKVFSKNTRNHPTSKEIFHFHIVKHDPFNAGHWYLSSGDDPLECFIWRSTDDGLTWTEINDLKYSGESQDIHRLTNMYFTQDYIYWATDDYVYGNVGGAMWCKTPRNIGSRLEISPIFNLQNIVRQTIQTPYGIVFLTENRPTDQNNGLIWLMRYEDLTKAILIGKTEGGSYGGQMCDYSYGGRIFLPSNTIRKYKLYPNSCASECGFSVLTINKSI